MDGSHVLYGIAIYFGGGLVLAAIAAVGVGLFYAATRGPLPGPVNLAVALLAVALLLGALCFVPVVGKVAAWAVVLFSVMLSVPLLAIGFDLHDGVAGIVTVYAVWSGIAVAGYVIYWLVRGGRGA